MAEAVVGALLVKLGAALAKEAATYGASLLCKEASALKSLFGEIRKAERELESMKAYLRQSEKFKDTDEITGIFIKNIRELSFQIEDVIDEFIYKIEDENHGGFAAKLKKRIKYVKVWHRLAHKLRHISVELKSAKDRRDSYAGMGGYAGSSDHHDRSSCQAVCFSGDEDLVGIDENAGKLKRWLLSDLKEKNSKVVTVWGMGGVGKTTLVDHVYKTVKLDFDASAWVTVSKSYQVEDLLKKIAREFCISIDCSNMDMTRVGSVIRNHLKGKRYILVLDDVWSLDVWINIIMPIFPTNCTSRFVLTSRKFEVASLATSNCTIKLEPLQEIDSYMLFCKLAFWNIHDKRCPTELQDLAAMFLQKCEGLPIVIECIGRLLSCKPSTYGEWKNVYEKLELQPAIKTLPRVYTVLKVSLEDLPCELTNCFLHCAIFPEDYLLKRKRLIRHWITAGFIKNDGRKTLEEVADGCLNELVNRSLLQVVKKNEFGRVKHCRMHDIIHHLALDKAKEECFGKIYKGAETFSVDSTRRLSIQTTSIEKLHESCVNPKNRNSQSSTTHLRAIHAFTSYVDIDLLRPVIASSYMLLTLDLQGTQIKTLPNEVFNLFNLRFLGLRYTGIENLPEAVGKLQNLEVIDAMFTSLSSFPKDIGKLKRLRFLYACRLHKGPDLLWFGGVKVPRNITNLTGLHNLKTIEASLETLSDVASLTKLRAFSVCNVKREHASVLCRAVKNMRHLVNLSIATSDDENQILPLEGLDLPVTLSKLVVQGCMEKERMPQIISSWLQLNLTKLYLVSSKLDEISFSNVSELRHLFYLELVKAYDGKKLHFSASSFPALRQLRIFRAPQLDQVQIEDGALETLEELRFNNCPKLDCIPHGIEYLTALEGLYLENTAEELVERFISRKSDAANECNEELMKISNIKLVIMSTGKTYNKRIVLSKGIELAR